MKKYLPLILLCCALSVGCVKRSITVETDPPQADVTVNGEPMGKSPVTIPFVYYGKYEIIVEKQGFKSQKHIEKISAPAYEHFPVDFVSEVVIPAKINDKRTLSYKLEKFEITPEVTKGIMDRAESARQQYQQNKNKPSKTAKTPEAQPAPKTEGSPTYNFHATGVPVSAKPPANK